jgi:hypothetical protein
MATMDRVCPFCGEPAGAGVFCAACGRNLAAVERLPTRAEWESGGAARIDPEPDAVADPDAGAVSDAAAGAVPLAERCAQATAAFLTAMRAAGCPGATRTQMAKRSTFRPGGKAHGWVVRPVDRDDDVKPRRYEPGLLLTTEGRFYRLDNEIRGWGQRNFPQYHHTVGADPIDMPVQERLIGELADVLRENGVAAAAPPAGS